MKFLLRSIFALAVSIFILLLWPKSAFAHPLDQTYTDIYLNTDQNRKLQPDNTLTAEVYISWQEMSYLYEKYSGKRINAKDFDAQIKAFYSQPEYHRNYILENLEFKSNGEDCDIAKISEKKYVKDEVLIGKGIGLLLEVVCPTGPTDNVSFLNRLFLDDFPYQSHEVTIYSYNKLVAHERLSKDSEIVHYPPKVESVQNEEVVENENKTFTEKIFNVLTESITRPGILTFFALFLVGFIHSFEGGHSKTIVLISSGAAKKSIKKMLKFVGTFVVTHIADILLLNLLALAAKPLINSYSFASSIKTYSIWGVILISGYMLINSIKNFKKKQKSDKHSHEVDNLAIAFFAGLAPCAMGWTIFALILSSGVSALLIFVYIITFALGIASALFLIYFLGSTMIGKILIKNKKIAKWSPVISYSLLLLVGLVELSI